MKSHIQTGSGLMTVLFCLVISIVAEADQEQLSNVELNKVRKLLSNRCFTCHGPDEAERKADLRLDTFDQATLDRDGTFAIKPGDVNASLVVDRVTTDDEFERMIPAHHNSLVHKLLDVEG